MSQCVIHGFETIQIQKQQPAQTRQARNNRPQGQRERDDASGNNAEPRSGNKPRQGRNNQAKNQARPQRAQGQQQPGQQQAQGQRSKPQAQTDQANKKPEKFLSEAARHQAMPQVGLFVPPQPPKRQFHNNPGQRPNRGRR